MKKLVALVLVAVMGLSMVGCGKKDSSNDSKSDLEYVKEKELLLLVLQISHQWITKTTQVTGLDLMQTWHPHLLRASA